MRFSGRYGQGCQKSCESFYPFVQPHPTLVVARFSAPEIGGLISGIAENGDSLGALRGLHFCPSIFPFTRVALWLVWLCYWNDLSGLGG